MQRCWRGTAVERKRTRHTRWAPQEKPGPSIISKIDISTSRNASNASLPIPEPRASTSSQVPRAVPRQALATPASSSRGGLIGTSGNPTSLSNSSVQIFLDLQVQRHKRHKPSTTT